MKEKKILKMFASVGAIITNGHFVYTSGRHGPNYVNKDALYPYVEKTAKLCREIAWRFEDQEIQTVVAPAIGGVILSQWVSKALIDFAIQFELDFHRIISPSIKVYATYAEKTEDGGFVIKRGYDKFITNHNVLVVEDIITTGSSVKKVIEAVRALGGNVVGVGALCNRGGVTKEMLDVPKFEALINLNFESYDALDCPLCQQNVPINVDVGKGKEFLANKTA